MASRLQMEYHDVPPENKRYPLGVMSYSKYIAHA